MYILEFGGRSRYRLSYTLKRAALNNLVRTIAVVLIYILSFISDILLVITIGMYCCMASIVTFLVFNTMLPPMLILYEKYLAHRGFCPKKTASRRMSQVYRENNSGVQESQHYVANSYYGEKTVGRCDKFFSRFLNIGVKYLKWLITVVIVGAAGYATFIASDNKLSFESDKVEPQLMVDSHNNSMLMKMVQDNFESKLDGFDVEIFFGVKGINSEDTDRWTTEEQGEAIMDESFDLSSQAAQQNILDFCQELRKQPFCSKVECPLETFNVWTAK